MTWREISTEAFNNLKSTLTIDVRSPGEHEQERIPGSINVPLLTDSERMEVGIIYKRDGDTLARRHALKIISPKIPSFVEQLVSLRQHGQTVVVYCWRGGLRSEAVASVLSIAGVDCYRITGGYKAWRGRVLTDFESRTLAFHPVVLYGLTGVGKTEVLEGLARTGIQVLDLESLANHRGSVFGGLGLGEQPTQKNFDAGLWKALRQLDLSKPVVIEGESRKVGKLSLPKFVCERIENGLTILVTGSLSVRAQRITADYLAPARHPETELVKALELLTHIKERLGSKQVTYIKELVGAGKVTEAVELLLINYYDPLYNYQIAKARPCELEVSADDVPLAVERISRWVKTNEQKIVSQNPCTLSDASQTKPVKLSKLPRPKKELPL